MRTNIYKNPRICSINFCHGMRSSTNHLINKVQKIFQKMVGFFVIPGQFLYSKLGPLRKDLEILERHKENWLKRRLGGEELTIQTEDHVALNAMHFNFCNHRNARTAIIFNGNGATYSSYSFAGALSLERFRDNGWNVVIFDYRGVLKSKGRATKEGLIKDGEAVFNDVKYRLNVPENSIVLHGHSIGGAVAAEVAKKHPQANYVNDRSLSSIETVIENSLGKNSTVAKLAKWMIKTAGWTFNPVEAWSQINGEKFIMTCPNDGVIRRGARFIEKHPQAGHFDLDAPTDHMSDLTPAQWHRYFERLRNIPN